MTPGENETVLKETKEILNVGKVVILGTGGMVGSRFLELFDGDFHTPEIDVLDLTDPDKVKEYIEREKPDFIVNFAAYTNVSEAENQRGDRNSDCYNVNVTGVKNLIDALSPKSHFIQISTDNVFPGSKEFPGPYTEDQTSETDPDKLTWYGYTKAEAERLINKKAGFKTTILRIIYPFTSNFDKKLDYVRKPLELYDQGKLYPMFTDQQVSVAYIDDVCMALRKILESGKTGVFHACSRDTTTPFELISYVLETARGAKGVVKPISIDEFIKTIGNPVRYPKYGGLKVEKTEKELGIVFGTWKQMVDKFVSKLPKED